MNGQRRELLITGVALSPEFIYALGPGQMMPDPRRYGIVWAPRASLEAAYDLEGVFSNVVLKLAPGANPDRVIEVLDRLSAPMAAWVPRRARTRFRMPSWTPR